MSFFIFLCLVFALWHDGNFDGNHRTTIILICIHAFYFIKRIFNPFNYFNPCDRHILYRFLLIFLILSLPNFLLPISYRLIRYTSSFWQIFIFNNELNKLLVFIIMWMQTNKWMGNRMESFWFISIKSCCFLSSSKIVFNGNNKNFEGGILWYIKWNANVLLMKFFYQIKITLNTSLAFAQITIFLSFFSFV